MRRAKSFGLSILLPIFLLSAAPGDAFAYLDPGTGSILLQGLVASVASALMLLRGRWAQMRNFLLRRSRRPERSSDPPDER